MDAKSVLYGILDTMPNGLTFTGGSIQFHVQSITGEYHYPSTMLRYIREWRQTHRKVICISKPKSLYQMVGER